VEVRRVRSRSLDRGDCVGGLDRRPHLGRDGWRRRWAHCGPTPAATTDSGVTVSLNQNCFGPLVVDLDPGATVSWRNDDRWEHAIRGVGADWGTDGFIGAGGSFSQRFDDPGVYPYYCFLHPGMVGTVVVSDTNQLDASDEAPGASSASATPSLLWLLVGLAVGVIGAGGAALGRSRR
jgi:plastocyanin